MKKRVCIVIINIIIFLFFNMIEAPAIETILRVAVNPNLPPYQFLKEDNVVGLHVDIMNTIADAQKTEAAKKENRRVSVSGVLKILGVSRSGYRAWKKRVPSGTQKRKETVKAKIKDIYDKSKQNYCTPKITKKLQKEGETISKRTVGKYMKEIGIKAQWVKPFTRTIQDSDFSSELHNILDEQFNPERPNAVWCSDITYIWTTDGFIFLTNIIDLDASGAPICYATMPPR